jgi:hypothetical protein
VLETSKQTVPEQDERDSYNHEPVTVALTVVEPEPLKGMQLQQQ